MGESLDVKIARLEEIVNTQQQDIKETKENVEKIKEMLNGYLEKKIERKFYEWSGRIFWKFFIAILTSSTILALLFAKIGEWIA